MQGNLVRRFWNWVFEERQPLPRALKLALAAAMLYLAFTFMSIAVGLLLIRVPVVYFSILATSILVPLLSLFLLLIAPQRALAHRNVAILFAMLLAATGVASGGLGVTISVDMPASVRDRLFPGDSRFPLHANDMIAVGRDGDIFIGLQHYNRVQKYDRTGAFIKGWSLGGSGIFSLWLDDDEQLHVARSRARCHDVFDTSGKQLTRAKVTNLAEMSSLLAKSRAGETSTSSGVTYRLGRSGWQTQVVRVVPSDQPVTVIRDPFPLSLASPPMAVIVTLCGIILGGLWMGIGKVASLREQYRWKSP